MDVSHTGGPRSSEEISDALQRMQGVFLEMPGLHLTRDQAARLCALDTEICDAILQRLVESRFLVRIEHRGFARAAEIHSGA